MDNQQIAKNFDLLAKLMELHDENPFKIRSYAQAYTVLKKVEKPFQNMAETELGEIPGIGPAITSKIKEMLQTGHLKSLDLLVAKTPPGIIEMLKIRGIGPKKVKQIWKELEIDTIGELLYACNENRIAALRGFGLKTQEELIKVLEYASESKDKYLYQTAASAGKELVEKLSGRYPTHLFSLCGEISLQLPVVKGIEMLTTLPANEVLLSLDNTEGSVGNLYKGILCYITTCEETDYILERFKRSCSEEFLASFSPFEKNYNSEAEIFLSNHIAYVHPSRRDNPAFLKDDQQIFPPLQHDVFKGCIHNHTTYSDGLSSVAEMQKQASDMGYQYIVITDHSRSAFYANGLSVERVMAQWDEIDTINNMQSGAYILKGIESDILQDGELDYPEEILKSFDCVIASVHSNLKMDVEKATRRLIRAIENPYTDILGHPTGRLLLSRPGYPIHMDYIIDACASNGVAIELNANPRRLDIDYTFLDKCMHKGVCISINPDAHSTFAIHHVEQGIAVAQKVNIDPEKVLNTWDLSRMQQWLART